MSNSVWKYTKQIVSLEQEIEQLNILNFPTLENLDKRNILLSKIHTLKYKINNIHDRTPELGYGTGMNIENTIKEKAN